MREKQKRTRRCRLHCLYKVPTLFFVHLGIGLQCHWKKKCERQNMGVCMYCMHMFQLREIWSTILIRKKDQVIAYSMDKGQGLVAASHSYYARLLESDET